LISETKSEQHSSGDYGERECRRDAMDELISTHVVLNWNQAAGTLLNSSSKG